METIICFGDSNTYGFDPRSFLGSRYPADCRWPDVLGALSGLEIRTDAMNGRQIPGRGVRGPECSGWLLVLLGTNDLLQGASASETADRMERWLLKVGPDRSRVILIAPPPMQLGQWVTPALAEESRKLAGHYRCAADRLGTAFWDAGQWQIPLCFDGVHFTEEGQRRFARQVWEHLRKEEHL